MTGKAIAFGFLFLLPSAIYAGEYQDKLSECLITSATKEEKRSIARWVFTGISSHRDVSDLTNITPAQADSIYDSAAKTYEKLITERCRSQAIAAVEKEGTNSFSAAFRTLASQSMKDILGDPLVRFSTGKLQRYVDSDKIKDEILKPQK